VLPEQMLGLVLEKIHSSTIPLRKSVLAA
jgi:hypothetical protein